MSLAISQLLLWDTLPSDQLWPRQGQDGGNIWLYKRAKSNAARERISKFDLILWGQTQTRPTFLFASSISISPCFDLSAYSHVHYIPDTVVWIVKTVGVATKPLPGQPTHGRSDGQPIFQACGRRGGEEGDGHDGHQLGLMQIFRDKIIVISKKSYYHLPGLSTWL